MRREIRARSYEGCGVTSSPLAPRLLSGAGSESGFTLLELIIVLFLLGGVLSLVIPRLSLGDSLSSVGRKWVGTLRSLQDLAMIQQKTVRLYVDIDRGMYWPVILEGNEEKVPLDATWATPLTLPETIRFADIQVGPSIKESGRADLFFYPNGRMDTATMHLTDDENHVMGIMVEPVTSTIRITDQRIDPPRRWTIPERVRPLLQIGPAGPKAPVPSGRP
jgi:prepilin-type N-terminal cleavage/methylation domain-containing protein